MDKEKRSKRIVEHARIIARRAFEKRGNHSEIHIKQDDLMVLIAASIERWEQKEEELGQLETTAMIMRVEQNQRDEDERIYQRDIGESIRKVQR